MSSTKMEALQVMFDDLDHRLKALETQLPATLADLQDSVGINAVNLLDHQNHSHHHDTSPLKAQILRIETRTTSVMQQLRVDHDKQFDHVDNQLESIRGDLDDMKNLIDEMEG